MINVVLFEPEIPGNTGNIMRTCAGTNVRLHLIKPLGFSLDEKYIKRSGANYIDKCDYTVYENIDEFFKKNKGKYYFLSRYGHNPPSEFNFKNEENIYFIFGKESSGLPHSLLKDNMDNCMRLPMNKNIRALNLSNTVAIIVYEALRQKGYPNLEFDEPHKDKYFIENSQD